MSDNAYTNATDSTELTAEKVLEIHRKLQASLPELVYQVSEYAPLVNKDGEPAFCVLPQSNDFMGGWGIAPITGELVILHPDNLPELQKRCVGKFRLVPLRGKDDPT